MAPSDVEQPSYPIDPGAFKPMPRSRLVIIGDAGHINGASGYGPWPEGLALLRDAPEFAGV